MKLSKPTIEELKIIMKEEYGVDLSPADCEKLAYSLVGYFGLLQKASIREAKKRFGNSSASLIDNQFQKKENSRD